MSQYNQYIPVEVAVVGAGAAGLMAAITAGRHIPPEVTPELTPEIPHSPTKVTPMRSAWAPEALASKAIQHHHAHPWVVVIDSARTLGAKILVSGGGRCNVTHDHVDAGEYAGSSTAAIRKVLRRFDVPQTISFFESLGVHLKREQTGKLFPTTNKARTVLDALLQAATDANVSLVHPYKVTTIEHPPGTPTPGSPAPSPGSSPEINPPTGSEEYPESQIRDDRPPEQGVFVIHCKSRDSARKHPDVDLTILARRVIIATGGCSLPKSGSDGHGFTIVRTLGHTVTPRVFPALVPLVIGPEDPAGLRGLSGLSTVATLEVRSASGKRLKAITGSTLCTHFGLSGPGPMDISRYLNEARASDSKAGLVINWLPNTATQQLDDALQRLGKRSVARFLHEQTASSNGSIPERLAEAICRFAGVDPTTPGHILRRDQRKAVAAAATAMAVPIIGDRGWNEAEVTAGGVPLRELDLNTMQSRIVPGLYLCGEICDVDGRIGGYNFQWAWASGYVAGLSAASDFLKPVSQSKITTKPAAPRE